MAYKVPNIDEMLGFLVALFKGLLPDRNIGSRKVFEWKLLKVIAGAITDVHANLALAMKDVMPDSARGHGLDRWINIVSPGGSKLRKSATASRKANAGRVTGTVGSSVSIGDQLIHRATGLLFQINENATIPIGGFIDVDIIAISTGAGTRLEAKQVLEYIGSPPAGVQRTIELQLALDEDGTDAEQDGAARNRLLDAMGKPTAGGNQADYVAWALAQTGIAQAFCYPNRAGLGSVDVAALHEGTGGARVLNGGEVAALLAALQALAPAHIAGAGGALRVLTVLTETVNVEFTVTPDGSPQYAFDWDDTVPPAVLAWTAATRTLQFTGGTRPPTIAAGDRLVFRGVASSQDGSPFKIEALSGADAVILEKAPTNAPAATDVVYAGGPLTALVRDAVLAHINGDVLYAASDRALPGATAAATETSTANLQVLANGVGTANPAGAYGSWSGGVLRAVLSKIAMYTRGVRNQNVIAPAVDYEATDYAFPNDSQIGLVAPGYVLVRRG